MALLMAMAGVDMNPSEVMIIMTDMSTTITAAELPMLPAMYFLLPYQNARPNAPNIPKYCLAVIMLVAMDTRISRNLPPDQVGCPKMELPSELASELLVPMFRNERGHDPDHRMLTPDEFVRELR